MRRTRRFPGRLVRWTSLCVCFALVASSLVAVPFQSTNAGTGRGTNGWVQNGQGSSPGLLSKIGGFVAALIIPQGGGPPSVPGANLPDLDTMRAVEQSSPAAPSATPSTLACPDCNPCATCGSNHAPIAIAGDGYQGFANQSVQFNGDSSFDSDGDETTWQWNFGDSSTGSGPTPTHTYSSAGNYTVTLTVTDSHSATDSDSTSATIVAAVTPTPTPTPSASGNNAAFVSQSVPTTMSAGVANPVSVTMRNTGTTTWSAAHLYRLGSQNPQDNSNWGTTRVFLPNDVLPGMDVTFNFTVAPSVSGHFQWRMVQDGVEWFGANTTNQDVTCSSTSQTAYVPANHYSARLEPRNRTGGDDLLSRNFNWSTSVLGLPGRSGLDLDVGLSYNSLIWTKVNGAFVFDADRGFPGTGFRLGFAVIQGPFSNAQAGTSSYLLITPSGGHVELRSVGASTYESVDSSHLQLIADGTNGLLLKDGSGRQMTYLPINGEYHCTSVKDRNGNYISVRYESINGTATVGRMTSIVDTLGRTIAFNYDSNYRLQTITQDWNGQTHIWASFGYSNLTIATKFSNGPGTRNPSVLGLPTSNTISALTRVGIADGSRYDFDYTSWGQVWRIKHYAADNHQLSYTSVNLPIDNTDSQTDCPRFTQRRDWAENWNGESEAVTNYDYNSGGLVNNNVIWSDVTWTQATGPDGTKYREYTTAGYDDSHRGLVTKTEIYSSDNSTTPKKTTVIDWTQDLTGVSYQLNPRVNATTISDSDGNRNRTTVEYASFGLPSDVYEWGPSGATDWLLLRRSHTDYNLSAAYLFRRIIGLPSQQFLFSNEDNGQRLYSKVSYEYDAGGEYLQSLTTAPTQYDATNYGAAFIQGRGNVTTVRRWNVNDENNTNQMTTSSVGYNAAGAPVFSRDALNHQTSISYADSFSTDGTSVSNPSLTTLAYPTTITDADNYSSHVRYNYDFGAATRKEDPKGAAETTQFDSAGRPMRATNQVNGAYARWVYPTSQTVVNQFTTIQEGQGEAYSATVFDGAGRVRAVAGDFPNSTGHYSGRFTSYDVMGQAIQQTNPTEMTHAWVAAGDDSVGWYSSSQTYDWKGRPLVTANTDGTTKEATYGGCGCAGGAVVTVKDEGTMIGGVLKRRTQRSYSDALGRGVKSELLNWDGSVYSTVSNSFNVRDQITLVRQYQGTDTSSAYQDTTMTYDGYGRLNTKHIPNQQVDPNNSSSMDHTTLTYNPDDTLYSVTDARGASSTYAYNDRGLVNHIGYSAPTVSSPGSSIAAKPSVDFDYDGVGNRLWMNEDNQRSVTYHYDLQSRMDWEERTFPGLAGAHKLSYEYTLAGAVKKVLDETSGASFSNTPNSLGQPTEVTAANNGGTTTFASQIRYRAGGALKSMAYGNNKSLSLAYNERGLVTSFSAAGRVDAYQYYNNGQVKFTQDQSANPDGFKDRAFNYDHSGRLVDAYSGAEARDFVNNANTGVVDGPFRQTYGYDSWGNMLTDNSRFWSRPNVVTESYNSANRNVAWVYDAQGNLISRNDNDTSFGLAEHKYDVVGQEVTRTQPTSFYSAEDNGFIYSIFTNTLTYDGDGQPVRYTKSRSVTLNGNPTGTTTEATYTLRSTVLGGVAISEYNAQGVWTLGYVYAGGERIGQQTQFLDGSVRPSWRHVDPITGDEVNSLNDGGVSAQTILDPQGVNVGREDPFPPDGSGDPDGIIPFADKNAGLLPIEGGGTRCVLDGIEMDCSFVRGEVSIQCPSNDCGPRPVIYQGQKTLAFFNAYADGYQGFIPIGAHYTDGGNFSAWNHGPPPLQSRSVHNHDTDFAKLNGATDEAMLGRSHTTGPQIQQSPGIGHGKLPASPLRRSVESDRTCRIQVRLKRIAQTGYVGIHAYIVTYDSNGRRPQFYRAGPGDDGLLEAISGNYTSDLSASPDWDTTTPPNASVRVPGGCENYDKNFFQTVMDTNLAQIPYGKLSNNSNAFVYTAIKRAGLPVDEYEKVLRNQLGLFSVFPGWGNELQLKSRR